MNKNNDNEKEKNQNIIANVDNNKDDKVLSNERLNLFEGAINVPKNQKFKHLNIDKSKYYSTNNEKFSSLVKNPLLSEKTMAICDNGYYTFLVHKDATKPQITYAIEAIFGIAVVDIKTIRTGHCVAKWSHKKKKVIKQNLSKKALIKFNPDVEIDMAKVQTVMASRENIMRG